MSELSLLTMPFPDFFASLSCFFGGQMSVEFPNSLNLRRNAQPSFKNSLNLAANYQEVGLGVRLFVYRGVAHKSRT
jgi:hypothetical protein